MASEAKRKLACLVANLMEIVPFASDESCCEIFDQVALFLREALQEKKRQHELEAQEWTLEALSQQPRRRRRRGSVDPPFQFEALAFADVLASPVMTRLCKVCNRECHVRLCDRCGWQFCSLCAGYDPPKDRFYPSTGVKVALQAYCLDCMVMQCLSAEKISGQEMGYEKLLAYFSSDVCQWTWIPGFCDGFSVFSATWVGLEGSSFRSSAFYCGVGTERDSMDSRSDPRFLAFVQGVCEQCPFGAGCR